VAEKSKKPTSSDSVMKEAREAFGRCQDAETDNRNTAKDDITFARDGVQWPEEISKQRKAEGRPCLTINKMPAFIRQVVNDARQNKPSIKVHPADSGADPEVAEILNGLIRNIEYTSNADVAYDTATECAVSGGFGYIRVGLDYAYDDSFDMDITVNRVSNPFSVYGDPNSRAADSSDWDLAFVTDRLPKKQFEHEYKGAQKVDWDDTDWNDAQDWVDEDSVLVAEWWTRDKVDKPIVMLTNGMVVDKADLEEDEELQILIQAGALQVHGERVTKSCKVTQRIISGVEVLKTTEWAGKYIPIIPVYGDEFDIEGKRYFRSLIHNAIDAQRMVNYWRTTSTELVALAPKVPFIGPKGAFATDINKWNQANTKSHPFLQYDGQTPPIRLPLDAGPAAGALQEALNASDDMKAIIGLYDASLGARSNETSGVAINARQREGDVSTFHFIDNMARAIRHTGRVIIDLIPHVYTNERVIRVIGEDGSQRAQKVNTKEPVPVTDKKGNPQVDEHGNPVLRMFDLTAGKYDLTVTTGPSFTTRREEAAAQMTEMIRALPAAAPVLGKHLAKNLDWPGADEIAEELEAMSQPQIPPELQQAIEEGKQEIAKLTEENQSLKTDISVDTKKAEMTALLQKQKQEADIQLQREKAAAEIELERQKLGLEREKAAAQVAIQKQKGDADHQLAVEGHERSHELEMSKLDTVDQAGPDGKTKKKPLNMAVMSEVNKLAQIMAQNQQETQRQIDQLAQIISAPNELIRDPKTGKAIGSRKVLQ
jgi:hypothetical protein